MSETVSTTHKLFAYIPRTTAYYMYYKSMPLVFTPVTDAIWLLREESKKWSYKLSNIPKSGTWCLCITILDALACDVTFNNMPSCSIASL